MMPRNVTRLRMGILLSVLVASVGLAIAASWMVYSKPSSSSAEDHDLVKDANYGSEVPADDNDPFLDVLLVKYFGWHSLPTHSVQHAWIGGFFHHAQRYVIHLSPEEFTDLKAHIDSTMKEHPVEPFGKPSDGPDSSTANRFKWWNPPNKSPLFVSVGGFPNTPGERAMGNYVFEYDSEAQLLYIDASTP